MRVVPLSASSGKSNNNSKGLYSMMRRVLSSNYIPTMLRTSNNKKSSSSSKQRSNRSKYHHPNDSLHDSSDSSSDPYASIAEVYDEPIYACYGLAGLRGGSSSVAPPFWPTMQQRQNAVTRSGRNNSKKHQ